MKKQYLWALALCGLGHAVSAQDVARYVDPFIGTGAVAQSLSGNNYPGATVTFRDGAALAGYPRSAGLGAGFGI